jgi:hypothetical protein
MLLWMRVLSPYVTVDEGQFGVDEGPNSPCYCGWGSYLSMLLWMRSNSMWMSCSWSEFNLRSYGTPSYLPMSSPMMVVFPVRSYGYPRISLCCWQWRFYGDPSYFPMLLRMICRISPCYCGWGLNSVWMRGLSPHVIVDHGSYLPMLLWMRSNSVWMSCLDELNLMSYGDHPISISTTLAVSELTIGESNRQWDPLSLPGAIMNPDWTPTYLCQLNGKCKLHLAQSLCVEDMCCICGVRVVYVVSVWCMRGVCGV